MKTLPKYIVIEFLKLLMHNESSKQFDIGVASILFKNVNHFSFLIAPATGTSGTDVLTVEGDIEVM